MDVRNRRILLIGDSHSAGTSTPGGRLAAELQSRGAANVRVDARKGRSAVSLWKEAGVAQAMAANVDWKPDIVVVMLGTNDATLTGVKADEAAFRRIVAAFPSTVALVAIGPPTFPTRPDLERGAVNVYATLARVFGPGSVIDARPLGATDTGYHFTSTAAKPFALALADALTGAAKAPGAAPGLAPGPAPAESPPAGQDKPAADHRGRWIVGGLVAVALGAAVVMLVSRRRRLGYIGRERIPGGLAPGGACPPSVNRRELAMGLKVEREHTDDPAVAREIACDHLTEDPRYYTKLKAIEQPTR